MNQAVNVHKDQLQHEQIQKIKMQNTVSDCFNAVTCRNYKHAQTLTSRILKIVATSLDFVQMEILFTVCVCLR